MSRILNDRLQLGPFTMPLMHWQHEIVDLFLASAVKEGVTVLRIETQAFESDPGTLTLVVPFDQPTVTTEPAPAAAEK